MKREALHAAAQWYVQLSAEETRREDQEEWKRWHEAHPDHQWAWKHVESLQGQLEQHREVLPTDVANRALGAVSHRASLRRSTLKSLFLVAAIGGASYLGWRQYPQFSAQYKTAAGERSQFKLEDGSTLFMNTRTAIGVDFSEVERRIRLYQGEVYIQTAVDALPVYSGPRPFIVETNHGIALALGTRFCVRQNDTHTTVQVQESAVVIQPQHGGAKKILHAGECGNFSRAEIESVQIANANSTAWMKGLLIVDNWPLDVFLTELARYRPGYLGWSSDISHLRISGVFPLHDTDLALAAVAQSMPVVITSHSRYWTRVSAMSPP